MRERSNRAVSKTVVPSGTGGSNPPLSVSLYPVCVFWKDVRVVEGARLEGVCAREGTEGSNPSLSAFYNDSFDESRCYARHCFRTPSGPEGSSGRLTMSVP